MDCKVNIPYPKIRVEGKNLEYAKLLLDDYSGIVGEESAINQYVYQHFDKFNVDYVFSETLSQIAMIEMKHLELLGETIKLLGLSPRFQFVDKTYNCLKYWDSSYIDYSTNIIDMLKDDIRIEYIAIDNYRQHIKIINDKYIKKLLQRIILDEERHIECFRWLLAREINKIGFNDKNQDLSS